jgi:hypothetical protein
MKTYYAKPNGTVHGLNKGNVYHFKSEEWEKCKADYDKMKEIYDKLDRGDGCNGNDIIVGSALLSEKKNKLESLVLEIYNDRKKEWIKAGIQDFTIIPCVFNK